MRAIDLVYKLVRYSGLPFLFRELLYRKGTRILTFHDPSAEAMDRTLAYLISRYNVISLDRFLTGSGLPPKSLVITLDDGHIRNHLLLPVFEKYKVRPTIFLCSGLVGTNRHFWFLHHALGRSSKELKGLPNAERLAELALVGHTPKHEFEAPQAMSKAQVQEMKELVDLQSHGMDHPCLPFCDDEEAHREIHGSKQQLEKEFGLSIRAIAFPNGDHGARELDMAREAGYLAALTMDYGVNRPGEDRFRLKRLSVDDDGNIDAVSAKASGVWTLLRILAGKQARSRYAGRGPELKHNSKHVS